MSDPALEYLIKTQCFRSQKHGTCLALYKGMTTQTQKENNMITETKTEIDFTVNETVTTGIIEEADGTFLVLGRSVSKTFKTINGARKFANRYNIKTA